MRWWHWCLYALGFGAVLVAEMISWSLPIVAFAFLPSLIYCGVVANSIGWPRSIGIAVGLGILIDFFAPAPFGVWTAALVLLVTVIEWVTTTWLKQASVLSVFVAVSFGLVAATVPFWGWLMLSWQTAAVSPVIQLVPWWHWPAGWLIMSIVVALLTRLVPSPYERLF